MPHTPGDLLPLSALVDVTEAEGFFVGLDFQAENAQWRVYHNPCATDLSSLDYDNDLGSVFRAMIAHSCPPPLSQIEALNWAIFAVNNHTDPDASEEEDVVRMEDKAEEVLAALTRLRDYVVASGEDLPDWVLTGDTAKDDDPDGTVVHDAVRPLSDFAIHIGLIPEAGQDGPAYLWNRAPGVAAFKVDGSQEDQNLHSLPGAYINGDWLQWGEYAENGTTHVVYDIPANPWTDNMSDLLAGLLSWVKGRMVGRLSDVAYITEKDSHDTTVGSVYVGGTDPNLDVVNPKDWRTR